MRVCLWSDISMHVCCIHSMCAVNWHRHVYKMRAMRAAWSGLLLHTPKELVRTGMNAFKATWREEQLHRRLLRAAVGSWLDLVERNKAVAAVRSRIKQVMVADGGGRSVCVWRHLCGQQDGFEVLTGGGAPNKQRCALASSLKFDTQLSTCTNVALQVAQAQRKAAGLAAFQHFRRMSQLLSAAAVLKQWHARPLVLAHMHAWLGDTLHTTFYLCWWRWRRRAVARVRWRAALGLHMYRCVCASLCVAVVSLLNGCCRDRNRHGQSSTTHGMQAQRQN